MPYVKFSAPIRINLSGYDREAVLFEAGEHEVPERVAEYVRRNPAVGEVLDAPLTPEEPPPAEEPPADGALTDMKKDDLIALAAARGVDVPSGATKAEIAAAIEAADQATEEQAAEQPDAAGAQDGEASAAGAEGQV